MMSDSETCLFCSPPGERVFWRNDVVYAMWDAFPVTPGHALLIPHAHHEHWGLAPWEVRAKLLEAIETVQTAVSKQLGTDPDGWNVGFNVGQAAGQTIFHLHVHVIPRRCGDVDDPTGGVRNVIPGKGKY